MIEAQRFLKRALIRRGASRLGGRRNSGIDFPTAGKELTESASAAGLASRLWATMTIMEEKLETILAELRQYLSELYGNRVVDVELFGSRARGGAVEDKVNASDGSQGLAD
jgi:hypothetical protein